MRTEVLGQLAMRLVCRIMPVKSKKVTAYVDLNLKDQKSLPKFEAEGHGLR